MNDTQLKKLNKITYIINMIITDFEIKRLKPYIDLFMSDPENHPLILRVYEKIEKVVKE